jgi:hypothetical protein
MSKYFSRSYKAGDEKAINRLYYEVTGTRRTLEQFRWQWQNAPGGHGEIWLIEEKKTDGRTRLIGHHGVMPIRFTCGEKNLVAGKTENTMVHQEYRRKILYPRYEQKFLKQYNKKFDLLFSTRGNASALRQRKALGYKAEQRWLNYAWALNPGALASLLAFRLIHNRKKIRYVRASNGAKLFGNILSYLKGPRWRSKKTLPLTVLSPGEASNHLFFKDFWSNVRKDFPLTPRRDQADLKWRFWENPYSIYYSLICENHQYGDAYGIVRNCGSQVYMLEDIVCFPPTSAFFSEMLSSICEWAESHGANAMLFSTTSDENNLRIALENFRKTNLLTIFPLKKIEYKEQPMLRKVISNAYSDTDWFITPIVYEGRS